MNIALNERLLQGLEWLYGEERFLLLAIIAAALVLDWITGIAALHKGKGQASDYGWHGVLRTLFLLLLPAFSNMLDSMLGMPGLFFYAVSIGIIYKLWQSVTNNAIHAGWERWIPGIVIQHIEEELRAKSGEELFVKTNRNPDRDKGLDRQPPL
ncbi:phage holin family protein [Paenibacillus sp. N4]|uniref:phage holin family protein n=1 Tax=Paenibacillus vietnamensis TaxID=2590547 RepID=UPI001CD0F443|nr:phage holin family protein [Paenibacillus vietnamensis]MCA0756749.1 phage holin family protein [Paenibacillus vietnamensis]